MPKGREEEGKEREVGETLNEGKEAAREGGGGEEHEGRQRGRKAGGSECREGRKLRRKS